ncbi:carboxypeptidase-like regulatory domain-containing protein, partial [Bacteroidales bacterium OttesenSCG-928-I14]|nr:carboxypeptidase-like regulatory domain-containing protein [Bacteroidales bacterium OttesenSCG-928-I14]
MRRHILFILLFVCSYAMAQEASLRGTVLNSATNEPVQDVLVQLKGLSLEARTGSDGSFFITKIDAGTHTLTFTSPNIMTMEFPVTIKALQVNDIGSYYVTVGSQSFLAEGSLNLIEEEALSEDSEIGDFNVSSMMTSSNDVYISNTTYNFSPMRFKLRGYENRYSDVYINGIRFNDQERGNFSYGLIGGLNDATRNKDNVAGYEHSNYTFGQIGGSTNINTNASNYAPGGKASLAYTNRAYNLRAMATYSTGLTSKGWAVTGSLGYRWSNEGFIDGTFYNSLGYFLSVEKVLNSRHSLSLTTFGSPTQRAQQSPNVQETMDLTGSNYYNSYWGWQDGEKRNSRIVTAYEPAAILSHKFQINKDNKLTTSFAYKYSMYGSTALNWFNGQDPRPDYYKYLPSYYTLDETVFAYRDAWQKNNLDAHCEDCDYFPNSKERRENARMTQVDWESLYRRNYLKSIDESISDVDARLSAMYMVEERHNDQQMTTLSSVLNSRLTDRITLTAGIEAGTTKGMHYKTMNDLLGSQYFIDIDQFALRDNKTNSDFSQNDLNNPNRKIYQGDRFGYDYNIYVHNANAWLQNIHKYNHWDIYYGFKVDYTSFYREGNMRNGRAPENSYGKGKEHNFVTQSSKLG